MKIDLKKERGITLVALIITIVILIILAAVTIQSVIHDGFIDIAINGTQNYAQEQYREVDEISRLTDKLDEAIGKINSDNGENLIKFYIDDNGETKEFIAEKGMTWAEFIESKYNPIHEEEYEDWYEFKNTETYVFYMNNRGLTEGDEDVKVSSIIKADVTYSLGLISFYVTQSSSYTNPIAVYVAREGMTWEEFIESEYNPVCQEDPGGRYFFLSGSSVWVYISYRCPNQGQNELAFENVNGNEVDAKSSMQVVSDRYFPATRFCVFPTSKILISLSKESIEARNIVVGQDIAYYNFNKSEVEIGTVADVYIHYKATDFVRYTFEDGTHLEATDYHPIYTKDGWKSLTRRNGYEVPEEGNEVKTDEGWKRITKIETWRELEDCYDFEVVSKDGQKVDNYFANGTLVQSSL